MKFKILRYAIGTAFLLAGCNSDLEESIAEKQKLTITSEIASYIGEDGTRTNVEGTAFQVGDLIKLKLICPFTSDTQNGEQTWGGSSDGFYLLKWNGSGWSQVVAADGFDICWNYGNSFSPNIFGIYEAQPTPYVYTASTWTEERVARMPGNVVIDQYCHVFHHDQSREKNYLASDLLWAQQYSQTGAWTIRLSFQHVLCCLQFTVNDVSASSQISDNAVLSLEGMPDIDQQEIVVGDYYAHKSKDNEAYGYQQKASCNYENNGKVLGIAILDETAKIAKVCPFSGNPSDNGYGSSHRGSEVANTGTYTCYKTGSKTYRVIVPPCILAQKPVLWLRDGERRYSMTLEKTKFEQGHLYKFNMTL